MGHYYFRDNFYTDSGFIAFLLILSVLSIEKREVSELIAEINPYIFSGEIDFDLPHSKRIIDGLSHCYSEGVKNLLDGLRIDFPDWWLIVCQAIKCRTPAQTGSGSGNRAYP